MAKPESDETEPNAATSAQDLEMPEKETDPAAEALDAAEQGGIEEAEVVAETETVTESQTEAEAIAEAMEAAPDQEEAEKVEETPAPVAAKPAAPPPPRKGLSVILGGVIAAAIGAGATVAALPNMPADLREKILPAGGGAAELHAALDAQAKKIAALEAATAQPAAGASEVEALKASLEEMSAKLASLESGAAAAAADQVAALEAEIAAMKEEMKKSPMYATQQQLDAATAEAKARIAEAEAEAAKMRAETEAAAQRAVRQAAVARVAAAFDAGATLIGPVAEVEAAGMTAPAALKAEVPTVGALQEAFPEAARKALAVARTTDAGDSLGEKLGTFLLAQTGARSLTAREGNSPDAVLSRAQAAVDAAQFETAVAELAALPEAAQAQMQSWKDMVARRVAAQAALSDLAQSVQ
ncbi:hypothetical protein C8J27_105124 [Rhodobacter aestuarii]|uniref:Uncharacterized conserved protein n=1 Tax=Rhodobacter aestuarii TaxID=453582 RepID=A0A1N7LLB8_9RHOB|nr:hypothetical protein [Rhodobacter aestuarii]PTV95178.1 hypothetical protein C8J27_105124 [Rhodobacter aestuarii]SIS74635.1 Uncharacterized conserved protein [Rhodobacter aestuarii]